ncbi:MAG: AzlD domain-containing protein [Clostridia bacterium]|nr:AzlD domain-containing protein [Clostridia bacterium]
MSLTLKWIIQILVCILATQLTRFLPFLVFREGKTVPPFVTWIGHHLPRACMAMLVIYCLKDVSFAQAGAWVPAIVATVVTSLLHLKFKNMFLSICAGTGLYMILLRLIP